MAMVAVSMTVNEHGSGDGLCTTTAFEPSGVAVTNMPSELTVTDSIAPVASVTKLTWVLFQSASTRRLSGRMTDL